MKTTWMTYVTMEVSARECLVGVIGSLETFHVHPACIFVPSATLSRIAEYNWYSRTLNSLRQGDSKRTMMTRCPRRDTRQCLGSLIHAHEAVLQAASLYHVKLSGSTPMMI
jgi:hypothetical protein